MKNWTLFSGLGTFTEHVWISLLWLCCSDIADDTFLLLTCNGILALLWESIILAVWKCLISHQGPVMYFPAVSLALFLSLFLPFYFQHLKKGEWGFNNTVCDMLCLEELTEWYKVSKLRDTAILPQGPLQKWGEWYSTRPPFIPNCSCSAVLSQSELANCRGMVWFQASLITIK